MTTNKDNDKHPSPLPTDPEVALPNLPALSIRQPWAWLIVQAGKDVENRDWPTRFRGRFLIHASKGCTKYEYTAACAFARRAMSEGYRAGIIEYGTGIPPLSILARGGIVGTAEIVDCVTESDSRWFTGKYGFVLRNVRPRSFVPCRGALGFFYPANAKA